MLPSQTSLFPARTIVDARGALDQAALVAELRDVREFYRLHELRAQNLADNNTATFESVQRAENFIAEGWIREGAAWLAILTLAVVVWRQQLAIKRLRAAPAPLTRSPVLSST